MALKYVVFADPDNIPAKELLADAYEQMGYQAESGPWRSVYLQGAYELRNGVPDAGGIDTASPDTIRAMSPDLLFTYMGVRLNGERAAGKTLALNVNFTDLNQTYGLRSRTRAERRPRVRRERRRDADADQVGARLGPTRGGDPRRGGRLRRHQDRGPPGRARRVSRAARRLPVLVQHRHPVTSERFVKGLRRRCSSRRQLLTQRAGYGRVGFPFQGRLCPVQRTAL